MTEFEVGAMVVLDKARTLHHVRGGGATFFERTDEFVITAIRGGLANLRPLKKWQSNVVSVWHTALTQVRPIGVPPEGGIDINNERIRWIFEDAARLAERLDLCSEFDRVTDALGAPGRERSFTITVSKSDGVRVTAEVRAHSRRLAEEKLRATFQTDQNFRALEA